MHIVVLSKENNLILIKNMIFFSSCSHVRFRAEPFQILTLPINRTNTTLERILSQLTKIEIVYNKKDFF